MSPKKKNPELRVVFDSNVLFTQVASDLFNHTVSDLIKGNSNHSDLTIFWYLPEVVMLERKYQMIKRGFDLLPSLKKIERLLGHQLNITEEIIESRIDTVISKQIEEFRIHLQKLNIEEVDWNKLIRDAVFRIPPFESGKKEKGFRDALIAETFLQIASQSPKTPSVCRVVLVANDGPLREAVQNRINDAKNIRILSNIDELKGLINTLVSDVTEEFVEEIQKLAGPLFFKPKDNDTLYLKNKIGSRIWERYENELEDLPEGATSRSNDQWYVGPTTFFDKKGQKVSWSTLVYVESKAHNSIAIPPPPQFNYLTALTNIIQESDELSGVSALPSTGLVQNALRVGSQPKQQKRLVAVGKTFFEVIWSTVVSTARKLTNAKIEEILFIDTQWESETPDNQ